MALVEGLDDAVGAEMERIRAELKQAIKDSPHTMAEIASMAGVDQSSIYRFLSGATSALTDNVVRVGLIANARLQISAQPQRRSERNSEGEQSLPFRIVRNERNSSSGSRSSTSRTSSGSSPSAGGNIKRMSAKAKPESSTDQRRKTPPSGGGICGYNAQVIHLPKHICVSPERRSRRSA